MSERISNKKAFIAGITRGKRFLFRLLKKISTGTNTHPLPSEEKKQIRTIILKDSPDKLNRFSSLQEINNN